MNYPIWDILWLCWYALKGWIYDAHDADGDGQID